MPTTGKVWVNNGVEDRLVKTDKIETPWVRGRLFAPCPRQSHCNRGHKYTPENTYQRTDGQRECRACIRQRRVDWYRDNPNAWRRWKDKYPEKARVTRMNAGWKFRGIKLTVSEYEQMLEDQKNICALCGFPPTSKRLVPDHDHTTGAIRGLIHESCNLLIGDAKDSIELLELAIKYLRNSRSRNAEQD